MNFDNLKNQIYPLPVVFQLVEGQVNPVRKTTS